MLSTEENFRLLSSNELMTAYMAEVQVLSAIASLPEYPGLLEKIQHYSKFLRARAQSPASMSAILDETKNTRIVEVAKMSSTMRGYLCLAHLAACCILFEGFRVNLKNVGSNVFASQVQQMLSSPHALEPQQLQVLMRKLMGMDAVRVTQLLRVLGLITRKSDRMYQLGLGASTGEKDIRFVHAEPLLTIEAVAKESMVTFSASQNRAADVIINDLDPRYLPQYEQLAKNPQFPATGYVCDTFELLEKLAGSDIHKRNFVTMLRIEPAMIPDAVEFLRRLHPVLDDTSDFVLTIGLGDSAEAYQQRVGVVNSMFGRLEDAGLRPVLFRLHLGGDIVQQGLSLQFGSPRSASFEILYCRLEKKALKKFYG